MTWIGGSGVGVAGADVGKRGMGWGSESRAEWGWGSAGSSLHGWEMDVAALNCAGPEPAEVAEGAESAKWSARLFLPLVRVSHALSHEPWLTFDGFGPKVVGGGGRDSVWIRGWEENGAIRNVDLSFLGLQKSKGDRYPLARHLAMAIDFARLHLAAGNRLLITCNDGE